jgi:DNA-binding NtrC family response regulator
VFLSGVDSLPLHLQPRLQRALAERQVRRAGSVRPARIDVRVVASARPDLAVEVERGRFARELLFRLGAATVEVPPLRARLEDVPRLVRHFLARISGDGGGTVLSEVLLAALSAHDWPGNVPELAAVAARAAAGSPVPFGASAAAAFATGKTFKSEKDRWESEFERAYVEWLLERTEGNISQAAREAGMDRKYLHKLMRKHGLGKRS